jgi:hypothetical protein
MDAIGTTTVLRRADGSVRKTILPDGRTEVSDATSSIVASDGRLSSTRMRTTPPSSG